MGSMATRKKAATRGVASRLRQPTPAKVEAAQRKFEEGLVQRGEAAPAGSALPPGATHEIVGKDEAGKPRIKRKRFSLS